MLSVMIALVPGQQFTTKTYISSTTGLVLTMSVSTQHPQQQTFTGHSSGNHLINHRHVIHELGTLPFHAVGKEKLQRLQTSNS